MLKKIPTLIATVAGAGYSPVASGTVGSAVVAAAWFLAQPGMTAQWIVLLALILVGWWSSEVVAKDSGVKDPSIIVVDEAAGMWIALLGVPHSLPVVLAAFLLFRFFDIVKCTPMKQAESLPGGLGIMADDVLAGAIARMLLIPLLMVFGGAL
ncbi:MAG: phosphatidylglycerophosphatase A [Candidatus Omnitrophica bacterium]|nr:phosphatidylglycerophosphatase A [Candidatus Omnitrophota bacterium]